jgi:hypothetical protein
VVNFLREFLNGSLGDMDDSVMILSPLPEFQPISVCVIRLFCNDCLHPGVLHSMEKYQQQIETISPSAALLHVPYGIDLF